MALKKRFVDRDVLEADNALADLQFFDPIDQKKRVAMGKNRLDVDTAQSHGVIDVLAHFAALSNSLITRSVRSREGLL